MGDPNLTELIEQIVLAGVALTTRALSDAAPGWDLTFPQWRVLVVLGEQPDGATVSEVAGRIGVTVPATSRQLRRLATRGLIEIRPDVFDRRAARARLTDTGQRTREAILTYRRAEISVVASRITVSKPTLHELAAIADALGDFR
ncbi:MAG TPA: MarR family transcriptional regulator [Candidatus Limnocylindrales bacterium]